MLKFLFILFVSVLMAFLSGCQTSHHKVTQTKPQAVEMAYQAPTLPLVVPKLYYHGQHEDSLIRRLDDWDISNDVVVITMPKVIDPIAYQSIMDRTSMDIIPGVMIHEFVQSARLDAPWLGSEWEELADYITSATDITNSRYFVLNASIFTHPHVKQHVAFDPGRLHAGLNILPRDVTYIWNVGSYGRTVLEQNACSEICDKVAEVLSPLHFASRTPGIGPTTLEITEER